MFYISNCKRYLFFIYTKNTVKSVILEFLNIIFLDLVDQVQIILDIFFSEVQNTMHASLFFSIFAMHAL